MLVGSGNKAYSVLCFSPKTKVNNLYKTFACVTKLHLPEFISGRAWSGVD